MLAFTAVAAAAVVVPSLTFARWLKRRARRKRMMHEPASSEWLDVINRNVALFRYLPEKYRQELFGHMHNFLVEKHFEGCGGLALTEEMRVTIAAQACILLLNKKKATYFPKCDSILVYPSAYVAEKKTDLGWGVHIPEKSARLGESWTQGVVVLAWDHVRQRMLDVEGGHNVVLHEFAHQLDQEDGRGDGTPILPSGSSYVTWARVLSKEYEELQDKVLMHIRDVMDSYGATNPAEFFAVATETFFEKGKQLQKAHPALYRELKDYYGLDPADWS